MTITATINHTNKTLTFSDNSEFSFSEYEEFLPVSVYGIDYTCEIRFDEFITITLYGHKPSIHTDSGLEIDMHSGVDIDFSEVCNSPLSFFTSDDAIVLFNHETLIHEESVNNFFNSSKATSLFKDSSKPFLTEKEKTFVFDGEGIGFNDGFCIRNINIVFDNSLKYIVFTDDDCSMGYDNDGENRVKENFLKTQKLFIAMRNYLGGSLSGIEDSDCDSNYYVSLEVPISILNVFKSADDFKEYLVNLKNNL